uniref:RHS repeat domain-containing protein n=1 Tax=Streptomonospora wellingtoniae TaxID=3075544 RepID=UPI0037DA2026
MGVHLRPARAQDSGGGPPDTGTSTFTYDAADRLVATTDARGQTVHTTYDDLGRKRELRDDSANGILRAEWVYDTLEKGQLTSSTRYADGDAYTTSVVAYDEVYRVRGKRITIPQSEEGLAGSYLYRTTYNPDGSTQASGFPAAGGLNSETVSHTYDDLGQPTAITGWETVVNQTLYSKTGDLVQREFSRGTFGAEKTWLTRDYDEATDRLSMTSLVHQNGEGSLTTQHYSYDDTGNILSIRDEPTDEARTSDVQCFDYDYLRRLTDVWTPDATGENACAAEPAADGLGGAAPYWTSCTYDASGNRVSETDHAASGTTLSTYTPPAEGEGPAHGVAEVSTTAEGAGDSGNSGGAASTSTYDYDAAGNMVSRSTGDRDQEMVWDAEGNLASVQGSAGSASFVYGADGQRLIRRQGGEWTLYLPGQEVTWTAGEGTAATRYYSHAGGTVAVREDDSTLHWLFADHNGTSQIAVDAEWGSVQQRRFTAFGQARSSTEAWPGEKGFVGGTVDDAIGLTRLGARSYDAELGRFISVDPLMDHSDSQMMHGYAYANNSPVSMSDPAGTAPCKDDRGCKGSNHGGSGGSGGGRSGHHGGSGSGGGGGGFTGVITTPGWGGGGGGGYWGGGGSTGGGYYDGPTGGGGGGGSGPVYVDPYDNESYKPDPVDVAQDDAKSMQPTGAEGTTSVGGGMHGCGFPPYDGCSTGESDLRDLLDLVLDWGTVASDVALFFIVTFSAASLGATIGAGVGTLVLPGIGTVSGALGLGIIFGIVGAAIALNIILPKYGYRYFMRQLHRIGRSGSESMDGGDPLGPSFVPAIEDRPGPSIPIYTA